MTILRFIISTNHFYLPFTSAAAHLFSLVTVFYNAEVMASRLQRLDVGLAKCYENDLDWSLLPEELREVSLWITLFITCSAVYV